jgi:hypothetical protein
MILDCFDDAEWHVSLWFPRVTREVLGLTPAISDAEAQQCLLHLLSDGTLEAGTVTGAEFEPAPLDLKSGACPDLYIRRAVAAGMGGSR